MNERDKKLAEQATTIEYGVDRGFDRVTFDKEKYAALIRADEREALKAENWTVIMREGCLVTWGDAEELGERVRAVIKARGDA
jgi:hypothetical protein